MHDLDSPAISTDSSFSSHTASVEKESETARKSRFTRFPVRVRAHLNPLSNSQRLFHKSTGSDQSIEIFDENMRAISSYTLAAKTFSRQWLDLGSAFGGLIFQLDAQAKDVLLVGLEIRPACTKYCREKLEDLRLAGTSMDSSRDQESQSPAKVHFINCNVMRDLGRVIRGQSIEKVFITYADPHFKARNVRRRLLCESMISLIAFVLVRKDPHSTSDVQNGRLYIVTDVKELMDWMKANLENFPSLFNQVGQGLIPSTFEESPSVEKESTLNNLSTVDSLLPSLIFASEDAQRCTRRKLDRFWAVYERN
ncbi:tRNA (guanine-N(7)-)-methyltransferase [Perkinsela sp. CCAP 1560/4]|nr:tRNA (guanine-N(7)-)-methyltransferase [Perkinsela sp. CCAP 1560/4]|eukprot:KNH08074.1 tRNA (guanine-N(7)-)-methyltransferase [Perkinsela sp. CCAP 1560/4]